MHQNHNTSEHKEAEVYTPSTMEILELQILAILYLSVHLSGCCRA